MRVLAVFAALVFVSPVWASSYSSLGCANYLAAKAYVDGVRAVEYEKARSKNRETLKQLEKLNGRWVFTSGDVLFEGLKEAWKISSGEFRENSTLPSVVLSATPAHDILSPQFSPVNEGWQTRRRHTDYVVWYPVVRTIFTKVETISRTSVKDGTVTFEIIRRQPSTGPFRGKLISHLTTIIEPDQEGSHLTVTSLVEYPRAQGRDLRTSSAVFTRVK